MDNTQTNIEISATTVKTTFAEIAGKKIAYRTLGNGDPIILCNRFRGILDSWDPSFLDQMAKKFKVIIFDYTGIGLSSGVLPVEIAAVAEDVKDLAAFLNLSKFVLAGWSYGGTVAQTFAVHYPDLVSHLILMGTKLPGKNDFPSEDIFFTHALKPVNDLADEIVLFFEPASRSSRKAAKRSHKRIAERTEDLDAPVPEETFKRYLDGVNDYTLDAFGVREKLGTLNIPMLVISGDHDIVFPAENWYAMTGKLPNMFLLVLPQTGHGPHHQHPKLTAKYIRAFIKSARI
jgi:pimeloyl-ACP methyl ester carboxylesterase